MGGAAREAWLPELQSGLTRMGIRLDAHQCDKLIAFLLLLEKWNSVFNLTAIRDPNRMVSRQLLDSLSVLPYLKGPRVLDVGTGPGLPGVPLAVAQPDLDFVLLDSNGKKTRFVQQACVELGLNNIDVVRCRIEEFHPVHQFDTVTSRAFTALPRMYALTARLIAAGGHLLEMRGKVPPEEIEQLSHGEKPIEVIPLRFPGSDGERHAVLIG